MKKTLMCVFLALCAAVVYAGENVTSPTLDAPYLRDVSQSSAVQTKAEIKASIYPQVNRAKSPNDNPACLDFLVEQGRKSAPLCPGVSTKKYGGNGSPYPTCRAGSPGPNEWKPIAGLVIRDIEVKPQHQKTCRILVNWNVRVVGNCVTLPHPWPTLCAPFHGTLASECPAGPVTTKLWINGKAVSEEYPIELPPSDAQGRYVSDPTIVGSFLIEPKDLAQYLNPATNKISSIEVYWKNGTGMDITSEGGWRNLLVNVMPVGGTPEDVSR